MELQSWEESGRHNPGRIKYKRNQKKAGRYVRSRPLAPGRAQYGDAQSSTLFPITYIDSMLYYWNVLQDSTVPPVMPR